jgi:penicillin-binding protein 1B
MLRVIEPNVEPAPRPLPWRRYLTIAILALLATGVGAFVFIYIRYARLTDRRLREEPFAGTADIYAANPPRLMMNVSDRNRESRRIVHYKEIPKVLIDAVTSAEDKRFFRHNGLDSLRMLKAAYVDLKEGRKDQGASTLSMQLARSIWLGPDKSWKRKLAEVAIAIRLEERLSKEQILEYYFNQVYLGRRGTFSLHGFGAAAAAYFDKDIRNLTLPEAAMLAGLIQRPSYYQSATHPERLRDRRNLVLSLMRQNGEITEGEYVSAIASPLGIAPPKVQSSDAPYFIDLVSDELQETLRDRGTKQPLEVYTTLDLDLQQAANEAVRVAMPNVDEQLRKKGLRKSAQPQVALVAIDPHTGEVKALLGGRNYTQSQLNRALAERQPGSVFKPFVYAAALSTALSKPDDPITPATVLDDEPTTFLGGDAPYTPGNFHHASYGQVTLRDALAKSINIPTVKLAEMTGYSAVAHLAKLAGLGDHIEATPSIALGSYEARPLDVAGAYTIYANGGVYVRPSLISQIRTTRGVVRYSHHPETRQVLDRRVAYLMVNLMEGVMNHGTAAGVRSRGFYAPAAGKTGTSRDGWFAGFTSKLICVVWVGFDDNSELKLEGAKSALPIWTEFMKRALKLPAYKDVKPFPPPPGIVSAEICPETGVLAAYDCPEPRMEFFIAGTEPAESCRLHQRDNRLLPASALSNE